MTCPINPPRHDKYDWKYCECGCHGHTISVAGRSYWVRTELIRNKNGECIGVGKLHLYRGHGPYGTKLGVFETYTDINTFLIPKLEKLIEKAVHTLRVLKARG